MADHGDTYYYAATEMRNIFELIAGQAGHRPLYFEHEVFENAHVAPTDSLTVLEGEHPDFYGFWSAQYAMSLQSEDTTARDLREVTRDDQGLWQQSRSAEWLLSHMQGRYLRSFSLNAMLRSKLITILREVTRLRIDDDTPNSVLFDHIDQRFCEALPMPDELVIYNPVIPAPGGE